MYCIKDCWDIKIKNWNNWNWNAQLTPIHLNN